ncbi:hypothetical protein IMSHALPRED_010082 [Imshaugia aleurites]|uniref:Uncharacterized protein n=1 Tax=Imshaugia aleurites TaxID=172621 RepID=A0A8H3G3D5_9LECA|nr:hypothetical protein IMSHALPRED_010082 [Imshaugia aleurites]
MAHLPQQYPALHAATTNFHGGHRSFLDVIFDANLAYDEVRTSILQGLSTGDFDNLRQTCRSIDHCLMMPSSAGPPHLRHPPHLIDTCNEFGLPVPTTVGPPQRVPTGLLPDGTCPNPPQSTARVRPCECHNHAPLKFWRSHEIITPSPNRRNPKEHLVCEVCRRNWHHNSGRNPAGGPAGGIPAHHNRHDQWRVALTAAHITVCSLCDREQKRQHFPNGHDGCVCYREYYRKRWLCQRCDVRNLLLVHHDIGGFTNNTNNRRRLRQVGNQMQVMPAAQGPPNLPQQLFWCPCGRGVCQAAPHPHVTVPTPWPGNHNLTLLDPATNRPLTNPATGRPRQGTTKQCVMCCGYIVYPDPDALKPTRRSARVADRKSGKQKDRKHTMLDRRGKAATRHGVSGKGFEVREGGGWA